MADNKPHLEIPPDRVRSTPINVRGRAKPFVRPDYSAHGDFLRERAAATSQYLAETADAEASESIFLQVRTPEELPVSGEKYRLRSAGLEIVKLSSLDPSSATVQIEKRELRNFQRKIERYASTADHVGKSYLNVIEDIAPVPIEEKIAPDLESASDEPIDCLLTLYSTLSERDRAAVLFAVRSYMARTGAILGEQRRLSNGVTLIEARLRPSEARAAGAAFSTVREIAPNHVMFVPDSWRISALGSGIVVDPPSVDTAVAVVDTGVAASCATMAGTVQATIPYLQPGAAGAHEEHGTFVGSRIVYGDDLESQLRSGRLKPICPLVDVPVIGKDSAGNILKLTEAHLATAIDDVIPRLPTNARVLNVSLGTASPVLDGRMSIVAQILDKHARERDLVVVTTAGNIRDPRIFADFPACLTRSDARLDSPGDSLLSLTVGSIAKYEDRHALSRPRELSAFSRRGPGPFGGIKPDLVAHGGNCMPDGTTNARIATHGLLPSGIAWACDFGTSFAAPLVASYAAQLFSHYANPNAVLVKSLLLHFTEPVLNPNVGIPHVQLTGLGEPNLERALWSSEHSAAFIHTGELRPNSFTYLPFQVPSCLAAGAGGHLSIKVTVVLDSPVNPDNHLEYAKSRVTLALRKPADVGHTNVGTSSDEVDADKWCPVSQLEKRFTRSYQTGEWELQLRLWTRDVPAEFSQRFAAVIEVIDSTGTLPVRADVEAEASTHFRLISIRTAA